ncbi:hypothetical protein GCM10020000_72870 [Streptomyces olivoverticillatus]
MVYVATMHNSVYAFDADDPAAAAPLWHVSLGPSAPLPDPEIGPTGYRDIAVEVGVISTPVIDVERHVLYVLAFTKDQQGHHHTLHALDLSTGQETAGGPVRLAATVPGTGDGSVGGSIAFTSKRQLQRAALTLAAAAGCTRRSPPTATGARTTAGSSPSTPRPWPRPPSTSPRPAPGWAASGRPDRAPPWTTPASCT